MEQNSRAHTWALRANAETLTDGNAFKQLKTMDKKTLKEKFPNLYKELEGGGNRIIVNSIRTDAETAEKTFCDKLRNFDPSVVDFIRRCDTEEEAETIIAFMEKRCEITPKQATQLRVQLQEKGIRSFGPKKEENYYFKQGGY